jgi:hypothetical protein
MGRLERWAKEMKTWTYWMNTARDHVSGTPGEGPPRALNGTLLPDCEFVLYKIEAETYEEVAAIHHLRMGWEPYKPAGEPKPRPKCGSFYYPEGSGDCWKCGAKY